MADISPLQKGFDLLKQLRARPLVIFALFRSILLKNYGFPDLWLRCPQAIWRLCTALMGRSLVPVFAFSSFEIWLRSYYSKLAWNFREFGRWGYVWDESLGFPMSPRFGSNWVTYFIYGLLPPRAFSVLSISLFIIFLLATGILSGQFLMAVALGVILLGSPAIIFSLVTRLVKPEVIWWSFAIPLIVWAMSNQWTCVWIIIGFLLLVNTSVSIILGAVGVALYTWTLIQGYTNWTAGLIWLIPGVTLRTWRFLQAYLDGNLGATVKEQARMSPGRKNQRKFLTEMLNRLLQYAIRVLLPFLLATWGHWQMGLVMFVAVFGLFVINEYGFKMADRVTLDIITTCAITSLALLSGSWWSLLGVCMVVWDRPFASAWQIGGRKRSEALEKELRHVSPVLSSRNQLYVKIAKDFPWFSPLPFPDAQKLKNLFDAIPDYSRVLLESDSDPREQGKFSRFHDWTYHYLAGRNIEFINHTFLNRMLEPALAEQYLNCLNVRSLPAEVILDVCKRLGVRYFIAFSDETISALQSQGYRRVIQVAPEDYPVASDMLYMPEVHLALLEGPVSTSIISPRVEWKRGRNQIAWRAKAGESYYVRYRYYAKFSANQNGTPLRIVPFHPFETLPLRFMSVLAEKDGMLELKYG